ncbi:MAG: SGNH/GDSL hydrolase family protein [Ruminococcaceae bacterium]|nr:SGNH/GDSL hydrolase family protein [Oscillospiraceae bacterium]
MNLSFEQIKKIAVGAITVAEKHDGIHFYRSTQKQIDAWTALKPDIGIRAACATGVRLDFHTTSKYIRFGTAGGQKYEVYVDGLFREYFDMHESETKEGYVELNEENYPVADEHRVTLYLSAHNEEAVVTFVELDDGASIVPHRFDTKMLFIGDSITQGHAADRDSLSYANRVSRYFNAESIVNGNGSAYFHETTFDVPDFKPDTVIVALGTNDFDHFKSKEEMVYHANAYLKMVAENYGKSAKLFYISPIWRGDLFKRERAVGTFYDCRKTLSDIAVSHGFIHVDGLTLVPHSPEFFMDKYIHPNNVGFGIYAENLIREILKHQ